MTFRFETLLRLRKNTEHLEQREMAQMQHRLLARQNRLRDIQSSGEKSREDLQTRLQQSIPGRTLSLYGRYFQSLDTQSVIQEHLLSETGQQVEAKRADLVEAMKKRRVLEILKDRELLNARRKMIKEEIAFLDEISSTRWQRKYL